MCMLVGCSLLLEIHLQIEDQVWVIHVEYVRITVDDLHMFKSRWLFNCGICCLILSPGTLLQYLWTKVDIVFLGPGGCAMEGWWPLPYLTLSVFRHVSLLAILNQFCFRCLILASILRCRVYSFVNRIIKYKRRCFSLWCALLIHGDSTSWPKFRSHFAISTFLEALIKLRLSNLR